MTATTPTQIQQILLRYKQAVQALPLTQQAYAVILKAIRELYLAPGEAFLEREITAMLEMSRTPVHEALIRLEMAGWIKVIPRKGFTVEPILADPIREISQITAVLDGLAAALATEQAQHDDLSELSGLIDRQETLMYAHDLHEYVAVDQEFHTKIVQIAANQRLSSLMDSYSDQMYRARLYTIKERQLPTHSIQEHRAVIAAMRAGSGKAADELMQAHRHHGSREIIAILKQNQE